MTAKTVCVLLVAGWVTVAVGYQSLRTPTLPQAPEILSPYQLAIQHCALAERLTRRYVGDGGTALRSEEYARCLSNRGGLAQGWYGPSASVDVMEDTA